MTELKETGAQVRFCAAAAAVKLGALANSTVGSTLTSVPAGLFNSVSLSATESRLTAQQMTRLLQLQQELAKSAWAAH